MTDFVTLCLYISSPLFVAGAVAALVVWVENYFNNK